MHPVWMEVDCFSHGTGVFVQSGKVWDLVGFLVGLKTWQGLGSGGLFFLGSRPGKFWDLVGFLLWAEAMQGLGSVFFGGAGAWQNRL